MPPRDSLLGTLLVALVLCVVCSLLVSTAAVALKDRQEANKELFKQKNILAAAALLEPGASSDQIASVFESSIVRRLIDLSTGEPVSEGTTPEGYDPRKAASDPTLQAEIQPAGTLPGFTYREPYAFVYEIQKEGQTDGYVLPIYGKGLWSTLYGFLSLEADGQTVRGISYYEDGETPGLGGEVNNPTWQAKWVGKKVYGEPGEVDLTVYKGKAPSADEYAVDGLSGATITTKGVDTMIKYWLGSDAFGKFLANQ